MMAARRQIVQCVSNHRVVLDFKLVAVFEDEHSLGLVRNRGLVPRRRRGRRSFRLGTTWWRIDIGVGTRRLSWAAAIEDGRPATVIIFRPIILLVCYRVAWIRFSNHGVSVRDVDCAAAGKKLATLVMVMPVNRRIRIHREQRINAAPRLIGKRVPRLNATRSD